jgi:hypothetical protein
VRFYAENLFFFVQRIGKRFELTLVWQSVAMIVAQLILLDICIRMRKLTEIHKRKHIYCIILFFLFCFISYTLFDICFFLLSIAWSLSSFWNWEDLSDYLLFLAGFTLFIGFLSLLFISQQWFVELLGSLALGTEALLGIPQAYNNWKNRSTVGLRFNIDLFQHCFKQLSSQNEHFQVDFQLNSSLFDR